jgi:hypothetical protein
VASASSVPARPGTGGTAHDAGHDQAPDRIGARPPRRASEAAGRARTPERGERAGSAESTGPCMATS